MEFEEIDREHIGDLKYLGNFIAFCREEKGLSQRQLALYADISNTELHRIETAQRQKPSPKILEKLSKILDIEYETLLQYAGYLDLQDGLEQSPNLNYNSLSAEERNFILDYLQKKWNKERPKDKKPFSKSEIEEILFTNPEQQEDPLGLAKIGFNMKDYNPPSETQKQQIKGLLEVIMKDNKKDIGDKNNESK